MRTSFSTRAAAFLCCTFAMSLAMPALAGAPAGLRLPSPPASAISASRDSAATPADKKAKKQRKVYLRGRVNDSFTNASLPALVSVLDEDSALVDSMTCWNWRLESGYNLSVPAVNGRKYIIKAEYEGYDTAYMDYELKYANRKSWFELPDLLMKRSIRESISLDGVVVTGTKVKFTYHGDTLVYNASAFNLPEGSMLDGLIKQLPGAELKSNGDIYINGRKVDYLTLNGKDFFRGDNKMMLENLPYYTVDKIKVFDKSSDRSEMAGHEVEKKDYVMDVNLKREYSRGYIANVEAGAGTKHRYQGRAFGLRYTDHSRLSIMGNLNNVNDRSDPGSNGDWEDWSSTSGLTSHKRTGANLDVENKKKTIKDNLSASAEWTDDDTRTRASAVTFSDGGDINSRSSSTARSKNMQLRADNRFSITKPFRLYLQTRVDYSNNRSWAESLDSTWRFTTPALGSIGQDMALINRSQSPSYGRSHQLQASTNMYFYYELPWNDYLSLSASASYNRRRPSESYSLAGTWYAANDSTDLRHRYVDTHSHGYSFIFNPKYAFRLPAGWALAPEFRYTQNYANTHNYNYRLDRLYNYSAASGAHNPASPDGFFFPLRSSLTLLPSTRDSLQLAMDRDNSNHYDMLTRSETYSVELTRSADNQWWRLTLPLTDTHEKLNYSNAVVDTLARRSYWHFSPELSANGWSKTFNYYVGYRFNMEKPNLVSLMPNSNTTSALATTINNPHLHSTQTHAASTWFNFNNTPIQQRISFSLGANWARHAIGTRTAYNSTTGHYTYMQDNVSKPNYTLTGGFEWGRALDSLGLKHFTIDTRSSAGYTHSVDFDIVYDGAADVLSKVNTLTLRQSLSLTYQKDKLTVGAAADFSYRHATGNRDNFREINTRDFVFGLSGQYELPFKLQLATDIADYTRSGYGSRDMNRDYIVWNAQLAYPFLKGKLTAKLKAYDILGKISSTSYNINAQGRTETWTNSLSRYLMVSLVWKFSKSPKK